MAQCGCESNREKRADLSSSASGDRYGAIRQKGQRGFVLILALVMLTILSLLGAMSLSTTNTELGISGNYRTSKESFFAAQRAVEYAETNGDIYTAIGTGTVDLNGYAADIAEGSGVKESGLDTDVTNQVNWVSTGPLPPGNGSDPTYFESRYYTITVTAKGPDNSKAQVEARVARVVPK